MDGSWANRSHSGPDVDEVFFKFANRLNISRRTKIVIISN